MLLLYFIVSGKTDKELDFLFLCICYVCFFIFLYLPSRQHPNNVIQYVLQEVLS
jgi:hypothetical protein